MDPAGRSRLIKHIAAEVGFDRCGITPALPIERGEYLRRWLTAGRAGTMAYLHRNVEVRLDPRRLLPGARSVVAVALLYHQPEPRQPGGASASRRVPTPSPFSPAEPLGDAPRGRVAMYAWGDDYHRVVKKKLFRLADRLRAELGEPFESRACVDTAPVVERELAAAAGVGWIGKNTLVLHEELGSYFFLGLLVTTLELEADAPAVDHCGTCTRCLDACPTGAFPAPYEMDAGRCISYLTIERRADIPPELHAPMGDWVFGCDICQQVCPYNRDAPPTREPRFAIRPPGPSVALDELIAASDEDISTLLRGSAMKRATPAMLRRNARIARENQGAPRS
jgi:epoxyqueuosine reductase